MADTSWFGNIGGVEIPDNVIPTKHKDAHTETRLALEKIIRELSRLRGGGPSSASNTIINNKTITVSGTPLISLSYQMILNPSDHLFPNGVQLPFVDTGMTVTGVEVQADPQLIAGGNVIFTLHNNKTGPALGNVTIPVGQSYGRNLGMSFDVAQGQALFVKSPATLYNIQNLYMINVRAIPIATAKKLF